MLYKSQKQKLDPKNITPHSTKRTGFTRSCRFSSFVRKNLPHGELFYANKKPPITDWWSCRIPPPGPKNLQIRTLRA